MSKKPIDCFKSYVTKLQKMRMGFPTAKTKSAVKSDRDKAEAEKSKSGAKAETG